MSLLPSITAFLFWNYSTSIGFITEGPTQLLLCITSFKINFLEYIQNIVFLVPRLSSTTYSNHFQWIWNFQSFQWSPAPLNSHFSLFSSSCCFVLNLGLFRGCLVLHKLLMNQSPPISVKTVRRFLLKYSRGGIGI